ncbi:hypothetical protein J2Y55_002128 [Bosea sp. BE125]|uniref:hypothetical protein n=1 Tax=Bosea sp. BE125 TaxID=2817909 RepID=UPI00285CD1D9|nr:hypothetical protein [Bosea sp. BE125]MDR6871120.1 hypothetical protein [Bosea sp. BE125]
MQKMTGLLLIVGILGCGQPAMSADSFPLRRGHYVANVPCGNASHGTLSTYSGGTAFGVGPAQCRMRILTQTGNTYRVRQECTSARDESRSSIAAEITVESDTAYTLKNEYGTFRSRYCAANTLPSPWGTR